MDTSTKAESGAKPYWNPYLAGVLLGLTLLATFVIAGQGLGASGVAQAAARADRPRGRTGVDGVEPVPRKATSPTARTRYATGWSWRSSASSSAASSAP